MEDLPTSLLTQQEKAKPRTGEELETFGKYAAGLYLNRKCGTLSEAVVETVKSAGLAPEQVRRVVEFTNTSAFLQKFASEGPGHKVVNFQGGPAAFPDVIRDLNDGSGGSVFDPAPNDYSLPPPDVTKMAASNMARVGLVDTKLAAAFAVDEVPIPFADPLREAQDTRDKLAGLYDEATSELGGLETRYMDLCDLLFNQVKQASLGGVPLGHTIQVLSTANEDPELFKIAFAMLTPRLVDNEVFRSELSVAESMQKTAGVGLVNPDHPMVGIFEDYCDTLIKMAATRQVQEEVASSLDTLSAYMSKAAAKGQFVKEVLTEHVPKAWGVARDLAAKASVPVGDFVGDLAGETAGRFAGGAVKYAPHMAVGLAAEEGYQRAKAHPMVQASKNFVLGRVPYTHQHMIRQYNMQMGM